MLFGYNTNGFAHHDLIDAIDVLGEIGYQSVAITLGHQALNPNSNTLTDQLMHVTDRLSHYGMRSVIETGARFLLDPWVKHEPTLLTADADARQVRIGFLRHAVEIAAALGSDCVSLWSGMLRDDVSDEAAFERLCSALGPVIDHAKAFNVSLGFEPEPAMFIDTMQRYEQLAARIDAACFQLTLDVGHLHCLGELPIADHIRRWRDRLVNVHIEDMRQGVHEHLMFGQGEMDFPPLLAAFEEIDYQGGLHVELSRHSHQAPQAAQRAFDFLTSQRANDLTA